MRSTICTLLDEKIPHEVHGFVGPMKSGKTLSLVNRIGHEAYAIRPILQGVGGTPHDHTIIFRPSNDVRDLTMVSLTGQNALRKGVFLDPAHPELALDAAYENRRIVGFDEAQFFDVGIVDVVEALRDQGRYVLFTGLDLNFRGEPFGATPHLMAVAHTVTKLAAKCQFAYCGMNAHRTQLLHKGRPAPYTASGEIIEGQQDDWKYEPRCFAHYVRPEKP